MRNFHQYGIDTKGRNSGKIKTICPQCNDTRGHKGDKSFSVNLSEGTCYCHHCGYKLYVPDDAEERQRQQRREQRRKASQLPSHFRRPTFDPAKAKLSEKLENTGRKNAVSPKTCSPNCTSLKNASNYRVATR